MIYASKTTLISHIVKQYKEQHGIEKIPFRIKLECVTLLFESKQRLLNLVVGWNKRLLVTWFIKEMQLNGY